MLGDRAHMGPRIQCIVLPVSRTPLRFDGEQAYQTTKEFVTKNPKRVLDSIEARQATGYIREFLKREGYQVESSRLF